MLLRASLLSSLLVTVFLTPLVRADKPATGLVQNTAAINFERDIRPIFSTRCLKCHGADEPKGELSLTSRESAVKAGAINPDQPGAGSLLERVTSTDEFVRMPPEGEPLTKTEIDLLRRWISSGADWPQHWAYRPLVKPAVPVSQAEELRDWCETDIDRFIVKKLEAAGLSPSPLADRLTLLRRASFDLRGVPPTPEEVDEFLNDPSPDAWAHCVDRLLASPQYGERWARHWMDLVHYAETHGHDQDRPREHAWPYRDYLIQSFNTDKPYDRFVAEQVAGDVLDPLNPDAIVATGFLAAGPWDESSLRDIREDSLDREIGRYLDRDDIVTTVMSTFASTSIHCARCHHHKFDPISQEEYYGLQAVFAGTDKANRAYDPDPEVGHQRLELNQQLANLEETFKTRPAELVTPDTLQSIATWETKLPEQTVRWQPLKIVSVVSQGGASLTPAEDQTVLASGPRPDKDVYRFEGTSELSQITALRLEVLTHESLPMQGPGRQNNGNLHLNEIRISQAVDSEQRINREITIIGPFADFDQQGWDIAKSIDGNPNTAWGIFPEVSKPHSAVFPFKAPVPNNDQNVLRIELQQIHGDGHLIGRFRISATNATPERLQHESQIPLSIWNILDVPAASRSPEQQSQLAYWYLKDQLQNRLHSLPPQQLVYCGTSQFEADGSFRPSMTPRTINVLKRGLVTQPMGEATPRGLACIAEISPQFDVIEGQEGSRRLALARWLSDKRNPLVWRSIANRVWLYHFGRGLVTTPNDFGLMGASPSHPELLDWLAVTLREHNGSLKALHRLILTSAVYQQTSDGQPDAAELDADNRLLWRMNRHRLDAESFRDALLVVSGTLDPRMGGPSDRQFIQTAGVHVTLEIDYQNFNVDDPANYRRSVYRFLFRTIPDPFMEALDCPDASQLTPKRNVSLTALQALATLNDKFVVRQSEKFAELLQSKEPELDAQIELAYRRMFGRTPHANELQAVREYAQQHGLANACRFLLNTNEFLFVD